MVEAALNRYSSLGVDANEQGALDALHQTLERYSSAFEKARAGANWGAAVKAIDSAVFVDDGPAFTALSLLEDRLREDESGCEDSCRPQLLAGLHKILGYGGMIHHYKNFVLRGEPVTCKAPMTIWTCSPQSSRQSRHCRRF